MKKVSILIMTLLTAPLVFAQNNKAKEIVGKMTLEEKVKFVIGNGFKMPGATPEGPVIGQTQDKVPGAAGTTFAMPKLGIPTMVVADGPAGLRIQPFRNNDSTRSYYATAFPVATLIASSWDISLAKELGESMGHEVKEYGVDIILGPGMNIHRNPLGGRNFEYYSEDPLISGKMAAAVVNGIQSNGVGTSIKHFAANNQERNRNTVNTIVSERALREIYLRGFEIAVKESHPWTVMSSYNKLDDIYTSENYDLLTTILRKEWGFKGFVMSDWFGGKDPVAQMKAGNDLLMPGTPQQSKKIMDAVEHDSLDVKVLDENAERILNILFESPSYKGYKFSDKPDLKKDALVARKVASEGMILLKNTAATLPLKNIKKIAAFGNTSYDLISGGTGSGDVNEAYTISLVEGLNNAGYTLDESLKKSYVDYIEDVKAKRPKKRNFFDNPPPVPEMDIQQDVLTQKAMDADVALITIGRNAGEGADRKLENDFYLSAAEKTLIHDVATAFHQKNKKVVVVLNIGGVIEIASWRDMVDAVVLAWQPGLEAGNAIAHILNGEINPSGKLTSTFPVDYPDVPSAKNFPGKEFPDQATTGNFGFKQMPAEVVYEEGIYVGYRYYSTFNVKPAYEFGFGLSYTDFSYGKLVLSSTTFDKKITATLTITNSGKVPGKEVVQLYLSAPAGKSGKPAFELKGFAKTALLKPGASEKIVFTLTPDDLASFNTDETAWIADAGTYTVNIGSSSANIKQTANFSLAKDITTEKCTKVLVPKVDINELKH